MKQLSLTFLIIIFSFSAFGKKAEPQKGYYYNTSGEKIEGMFIYRAAEPDKRGELIKYKNGKKAGKINGYNIKSFVLGLDSFIIVKDFTIGNGLGKEKVTEGFVRVISLGHINLFEYKFMPNETSFGYSSAVDILLMQKEDDSGYTAINRSMKMKDEFAKAASMIKDNKELSERAKGLKIRKDMFITLAGIIQEYNDWKAKQ